MSTSFSSRYLFSLDENGIKHSAMPSPLYIVASVSRYIFKLLLYELHGLALLHVNGELIQVRGDKNTS